MVKEGKGKKRWVVFYASNAEGKKKGKENLDGVYTGTPGNAAKKALNQICRKSKIHGVCSMIIGLRHHDTKRYYKVNRKKLDEPFVQKIGDREVKREYVATSSYLKDFKEEE